MHTFFKITSILFESIKEVIIKLFGFSSGVLSSVALLLNVVIVINICDKGATKKFFINNRNFICLTLILQAVACLISTEKNLVKTNAVVLVVCLLIILYKGILIKSKTKKDTQQKVLDVKVKKKERKKKDESI